jgi:hypothetical protein
VPPCELRPECAMLTVGAPGDEPGDPLMTAFDATLAVRHGIGEGRQSPRCGPSTVPRLPVTVGLP